MDAKRDNIPYLVVTAEEVDYPVVAIDFDAVFRRFAPYVASIALRLLGRDDEVDDVVQDVFIDAYRGIEHLREVDAIKGWLATITVRKVRRRLKRKRLRSWIGLDEPAALALSDERSADADDLALLHDVYRALTRLPVDLRLAWTLRHLQGETLEGVARICECSESTIKRRLARAESRIRKALDHG